MIVLSTVVAMDVVNSFQVQSATEYDSLRSSSLLPGGHLSQVLRKASEPLLMAQQVRFSSRCAKLGIFALKGRERKAIRRRDRDAACQA